MSAHPILFVDDEANVLAGFRRSLGRDFEVLTADSGPDGLRILAARDDVATVVSDMRMPIMSGAEFLAEARALRPDATRILLTGHTELDAAIAAVNEGHLFRFLTKPCSPEDLRAALAAGIEHHRLVRAERELTEGTLRGVVGALADVVGMANPRAHAAARRVADEVAAMVEVLGLPEPWEFAVAARLSRVGIVALPQELVERARDADLTPEERRALGSVPSIGAELLRKIPRLEGVAEMVELQEAPVRADWLRKPWNRVGLGAGLLKAAWAIEGHRAAGDEQQVARARVRDAGHAHHEAVTAALDMLIVTDAVPSFETVEHMVPIDQLRVGWCLAEDLVDDRSTLLAAAGITLTEPLVARIKRFRELRNLPNEIRVRIG